MKLVALVTGGNRGLGNETCRELAKRGIEVIVTCRKVSEGEKAVTDLNRQGGAKAHFHPLDVSDGRSIKELAQWIEKTFHRLDILVNNAGILLDSAKTEGASIDPLEVLRKTLETNTFGPFQMIQTFAPLMKKNNYGRIVNVSSGMGQLSEMAGNWPGYRISKTALNAVTRIFSDDLKDAHILVNSVCPGWVRTGMGGPQAPRSLEQGADTIVWAATLPDGGPTGSFFRDRKPIAW